VNGRDVEKKKRLGFNVRIVWPTVSGIEIAKHALEARSTGTRAKVLVGERYRAYIVRQGGSSIGRRGTMNREIVAY
jgi:hypothetical protein